MIARIAKLVGYTRAPTTTYLMRHPIKGLKALRASRRGMSRAAVTRAGAAVLAVPLGYWLVKRRGATPASVHQHAQGL